MLAITTNSELSKGRVRLTYYTYSRICHSVVDFICVYHVFAHCLTFVYEYVPSRPLHYTHKLAAIRIWYNTHKRQENPNAREQFGYYQMIPHKHTKHSALPTWILFRSKVWRTRDSPRMWVGSTVPNPAEIQRKRRCYNNGDCLCESFE